MKLYISWKIRGASHLDDKAASVRGNKRYQLRHIINTLNRCLLNMCIPSGDIAFDEGGVGWLAAVECVLLGNITRKIPMSIMLTFSYFLILMITTF